LKKPIFEQTSKAPPTTLHNPRRDRDFYFGDTP
jgi:hypothetical protein